MARRVSRGLPLTHPPVFSSHRVSRWSETRSASPLLFQCVHIGRCVSALLENKGFSLDFQRRDVQRRPSHPRRTGASGEPHQVRQFRPAEESGAPKSGGGFNATGFFLQLTRQLIRASQNSKMQRRMEGTAGTTRKEMAEALRNPPPIHGSARWATDEDLRQAGYLKPITPLTPPPPSSSGCSATPTPTSARSNPLG